MVRKRHEKPLWQVARASGTGRGWAAAHGARIPRARDTGASRPEFFKQAMATTLETECLVDRCANPRVEHLSWCDFHVQRAARLGIEAPTG